VCMLKICKIEGEKWMNFSLQMGVELLHLHFVAMTPMRTSTDEKEMTHRRNVSDTRHSGSCF
jgi:hypothetical protein